MASSLHSEASASARGIERRIGRKTEACQETVRTGARVRVSTGRQQLDRNTRTGSRRAAIR
jgi:hypothetical protein